MESEPNTERPQDELRATPIVIVGIVGSILTVVIILLLSVLFLHEKQGEIYSKSSAPGPDDLRRRRSEQREVLTEYRWVDEKQGIVRIPIDRAMELLVKESAEKRDSRSGK